MTTAKAITPGIHQMTADTYHADPCPAPSLSASIARVLLSCSPRHAWWASPRLNPAYVRVQKKEFDLGTAAHAYLLEGKSAVVIIEADDFKTKAAREARDAAYTAGQVPLIAEKWADVQAMAAAARAQLVSHELPIPFTAGTPEQTLLWREGGVWCRSRLDWLHDDRLAIDDLKTTGGSANPEAWTRGPLFANGYDVQAAFYLRGLKAVTGRDATFRFVVQETYAPYALSVIALAPEALALAGQKVGRALALWQHALATNTWPGYPARTCWAERPGWEQTRWLEREAREAEDPIDDGRSLADQLIGGPR